MIKPLYNNVLLEEYKEEKTTTSGIILTSQKPKDEGWAIVVAIGEETASKIPVQSGDKVLVKKQAATPVSYEGKDYLIIDAKEILAVVEK